MRFDLSGATKGRLAPKNVLAKAREKEDLEAQSSDSQVRSGPKLCPSQEKELRPARFLKFAAA